MEELNDSIKIDKGLFSKPQSITVSNALITTLTSLVDVKKIGQEHEVYSMKLEDSLYDARKFFDYYYKLHKVPHLNIKKVLGLQIHTIRPVHPYKLPILLQPYDDIFSGSVSEVITKPDFNIVFREVNLSKQISEQTSASYVHEITHTQIEHQKGIIGDYYNSEVLSIFNELFHTSILDKDERILKLNDYRRIVEMLVSAEEIIAHHNGTSTMSESELHDCCKYLVSDLKAYNLFIKFYYGTEDFKNDILDDIQSVFDGYLTVEELLNKYDISYESSQEPKQLTKYFSR